MAVDPKSTPADPSADVWTFGRLLSWSTEYFTRHDLEAPRLAAELLLAHAAGCRRIELYTRFEEPAPDEVLARFREFIKRAVAHEPIAYLVGEKEFFSLAFTVSPAVLIPRPETESVIEAALDLIQTLPLENPKILDLGTGSGCIAVTLARQVASAVVVATDISPKALVVARQNAERHGVADRVRLIEAEGLNLADNVVPSGGFDLLVSNPPYIAADAMDQLDETVRAFEPYQALTDLADGFSFYRLIAAEGAKYLQPSGRVIVEVADDAAPAVIETVCSAGAFVHEKTMKDRVTRRDRVVVFRRA
jgi:release factor glutamine methyltransferase